MTSQVSLNTGAAVSTQGKSQTLKTFKQKKFKPKETIKKKPEILWHHDLNGNHFNYNPKIANTFGLLAAMILEYIRYWCRYNVQKKNDHRAYSVYKTGIELACLFSISLATLWRVIGMLQKEGFIEIDKNNNHYGKINVYRLTKKYFDFVGLTTITRLEREIFFPNKEDVISQKSDHHSDQPEQKIDPHLSEATEEKITPKTEEKINQKSHDVVVCFLDNLYLTRKSVFRIMMRVIAKHPIPLIYRYLRKPPQPPIETTVTNPILGIVWKRVFWVKMKI